MRRICVVVACLTFAGAALSQSSEQDALSKARSSGALEVAVYDNFPPFSYKSATGVPAGIDVDLANALAAKLGLRARLRFVTAGEEVGDDLRNNVWKGHYLGGGVADVMLHVPTDPHFAREQRQSLIFGSYFREAVTIASPASHALSLDTPLSLARYKVGVELDTISDHYLSSAYGGRLRTAATRKLTLHDAVRALRAHEVDAVMGPKGQLQGLLAMAGLKDVRYQDPSLNGMFNSAWDIGLAVKQLDGQTLQTALREALEELQNEGEVAAIFTSHHVAYVDPSIGAPDTQWLGQAAKSRP